MSLDKYLNWAEQGLALDENPAEDAGVALASGYFTVADARRMVEEIRELRGNS
ncbi:MAG: hypothetical protein OEW25_01015 [Nitrospira sp.]|nr:hypothetical protein [Nitrospira sp.]MDH5251878.1 hypothetical protein [Nitrospira sp.]